MIIIIRLMHSLEDSFRIEYFLYIVDKLICSLETIFEYLLEYENIFGFLFDLQKFKTMNEETLKKYCINLESHLKFNDYSDIDGFVLFSELKILKEVLTKEINKYSYRYIKLC